MFCDDCTSKRYELPATFKIKGKQRVCDDCYYLLVQVAKIGARSHAWQVSVDSNPDQFPARPGLCTCCGLTVTDVAALKAGVLERIRGVLRQACVSRRSWQ